ncbi:MAG: endonuclease/exonuclease/phosphatase family protein [Bacteroidia bacterium]|nr:endonuclease/exonuclease/phosphatase family protein [Bacteroidia bacterium]
MKYFRILFISYLLSIMCVFAQNKTYEVYSVGFYNLENLFDTEDDPNNPGDNDFLPGGAYNWTQDKYEKKLDNLARAISRLGRQYSPLGPAAIGVTEIENKKVLEDLVKRPAIVDMGLEIIHYESPDRRGIDVGLLYNPKLFQVVNHKVHPYVGYEDSSYVTRDQLLVSGLLAGEMVHLTVNHWPSRYGAKSSILRETAAAVSKATVDSICAESPNAKILIMGDLNDDPIDPSCRVVLNAKKNIHEVTECGLFNPMWRLFEQGVGSLAYQGKWSLFDQIIVSHGLLHDKSGLRFWKPEIFNRDFLIQKEGSNKGYPFRTFSNSTFMNGYSDHFPVLVYLIRER